MKRSERRLLEEKLRYVALEDVELDPEREQRMLEQLKAEFLQRGAEMGAKRSGGHGIGRRVLLVSAAAILFVVLSFGYTVLMPESVTHAKGFVRTAAIWVNNTFHLGYEFEEPMENPFKQAVDNTVCASYEEIAANIPYPLVYLDDPRFTLQSITTQEMSAFYETTLVYQNNSQEVYLRLKSVAESAFTNLDNDLSTSVTWQHGEIECWKGNTANHALTYYSGIEIEIKGFDIPYEDFLVLCQSLKTIN